MEGIVIKKLPKSQALFEVTVPAEKVMTQKDKAAEALSTRLEIDGFRKGKAPYEVVKQYAGGARIFEEAAYIIIEKKYKEIIAQSEFKIIGRPKIEIKKIAEGNPLIFNMTIALYPEVKLADYKSIALESAKEKKTGGSERRRIERSAVFHSPFQKKRGGGFPAGAPRRFGGSGF